MYNPQLSYEENLRFGPSPEWNRGGRFPKIQYMGQAQFKLFDIPLHLPLGIPAGPLLSSAFVKVALDAGFSMPVYKTVRSRAWQSHPWPNVLRLQNICGAAANPTESAHQLWNVSSSDDARPRVEVAPLYLQDLENPEFVKRLSITNAFGVPSAAPAEWSADFASLPKSGFSAGQMAVLSFQGSRQTNAGWHDFLEDTAHAARLAAACVRQKGGRILEMNVSCPNESGAPIYTDLIALTETLRAAAEGLVDDPQLKLIVKLGVVPEENILRTVEVIAKYAHGISAINTVSANIVTSEGKRALGSGAEHGGVCGYSIRDQALEMVGKFHRARTSLGLDKEDFALIGVGGCTTVDDFHRFLKAGADVVHAATGAMWNLQFASECARSLNINFTNRT